MSIPNYALNDDTVMPQLGLGTYKIAPDEVASIVRTAIELGYRHFDTARLYDNEEAVGRALNDAINAGDVTREELYVVSKLWHDQHGTDEAKQGFAESLRKLDVGYLDNFLIHWPYPQGGRFVETWESLLQIRETDELVSAGVANFNAEHLDELVDATGVAPSLNQIELHPGFHQPEQLAANEKHGIRVEAWSPLARGIVLNNPQLEEIALATGSTVAQVVLRYLLDKGVSVVPKASSAQRLRQNAAAIDVELSADDTATIDGLAGLPGFGRIFGDPAVFPHQT
ncbi:aldo/keto reductase [Corynebacterium sp. MNWGS58]|uniref:aldo/keto reductase n=1 Tax=Corynebacterium sp. 102791.4 TaxID=3104612 RepID=UPI0035166680